MALVTFALKAQMVDMVWVCRKWAAGIECLKPSGVARTISSTFLTFSLEQVLALSQSWLNLDCSQKYLSTRAV
jgi:hypothetical protein